MSEEPDHPLRVLFAQRGVTVEDGMNRLQDKGLISDECVRPEDVAPSDVARVVAKFEKRWGAATVEDQP